MYSVNGMSKENFIEVCKTQLISIIKCRVNVYDYSPA